MAYDAHTAARQAEKRRAEIKAVEALGQKLADKLDVQDAAEAAREIAAAAKRLTRKSSTKINANAAKKRNKKANDRSAYVRFAKELKDRKLTMFLFPRLPRQTSDFTINWEAKDFILQQN